MTERTKNLKKWAIRAAKAVVLVLVICFVWRSLAAAWDQFQAQERAWAFHGGWLAVSGGFYLLGLLPCGIFWYLALRSLGQRPTLLRTLRAYYVGHLGKYVPGKALVVVLRAGLIRGPEVHTGVAAACVFLETLTYLAVGAFLAVGYLAIYVRENHTYFLGAVVLMVAAGLPTLPPIFVRLAKLARAGGSDPETIAKLEGLGMPLLWSGWGLMTLGWVMMGLSYWAVLQAMGLDVSPTLAELPRYTACVALATVLGFVAVIFPAGLVVREAVLLELMRPYFAVVAPGRSELAATAGAVLLRLVSLVSELSVSGILYVAGWRRPKPPEAVSTEE